MRPSLLLLGSAALVAACGGSKESKSPRAPGANGGTLVFSLFGDAVSIFPPSVVDITGRLVQDQIFGRLAEIDQDLSAGGDKGFSPRRAQKWPRASRGETPLSPTVLRSWSISARRSKI